MTEPIKGPWKISEEPNNSRFVIYAPWSEYVTAKDAAVFGDYRGAHICTIDYCVSGCATKWQALENAVQIVHSLDRAEAAEARAAQLEADNAELKRQLEQAQRAMALADVETTEELGDWIVGAQSEIANLGRQLRDIWDMQAKYMRGELSVDDVKIIEAQS